MRKAREEEDSSGAPAKPDRLRDQTERFLEQAAPYLTRHQEQIIAAAARGLDAKGVAECRYYLGRASLIADSAPEPAGPGSPVLDLVQGYVETSRLEPLQMEIVFSANSTSYNNFCTRVMVQAGKSRRMEPRKIVPFGAFPVYSSASRRACTAALQRVGTSSIVMRPVLIMR